MCLPTLLPSAPSLCDAGAAQRPAGLSSLQPELLLEPQAACDIYGRAARRRRSA